MNKRERYLVEKEKEDFAAKCNRIYKLATVNVLNKMFGFGEKRLTQFIDELDKETQMVASGMIGYEYYKASIEEKTGFKLEEES